jgi:phosphoribosylanthranilate isomerase
MTKIKICGITNIDDARTAAELGADALGFIFAASPRKVTAEQARKIIRDLPPFVTAVGVFAGQTTAEVNEISAHAGLAAVQLHGSEPADHAAAINCAVIRRIAVAEGDTAADIQARADGFPAAAYLLDPGCGSGLTFDWQKARGFRGNLILAGGLDPENIAYAVRLVRPYGVDACSGLESKPGRKDRDKIKKFIEEARSCER